MLFIYFKCHMAWLAPHSVVKQSLLDCFSMIIEFFPLVCMYWIKRNFFSLTISAFQGQWTINWMQCKTDKKTPANKQCMDQYLKRNAAALWSACLAGNEVWQKVKTSCIREDQALFQALLLAFGDVQNCAAFLYFKTNFWKVSCLQWYDFWKGRASLTKRSLLEWLSVCQDRDDAFLGVWLHVPSEWNLPACVKPWNKIMQECRYKNEHTKWQCSAFFCRIHWIYLGYFNSFILLFSPPCHDNVCLYFRGTLEAALCLSFVCAKSFVCCLLCLHIREF